MGNQHSASHHSVKPRKNVHWKSAGRPAAPGKPEIIPLLSEDEPNAITLRWAAGAHDGGAPLHGYQVECNRLGAADWIRTAPPVVQRPELVLTGLEPPHRYQFRVAALNAVGLSDYSDLSDVLTVSPEPVAARPPLFLHHLLDITVLENDKTEFRVKFDGSPTPTIAWFKDDYEIFSSRRTAISTDDFTSVLIFHQTLSSDEGEIRCTATNRSGHAVTRARLSLEAAPKLRYPRQYEDGLLYEVNETVFLKTTIVGKPTPSIEWRHDGRPVTTDDRVEISNVPKFSVLKIHSARRSDRGEYQIHAKNFIGEDTAAFLVTITAPPDPPRAVSVARQVDKSVTLDWEPPEDDGGCRIGNYVVEYYRSGWNVWLKATTSRKTNVTLFDLIEGSEYRFRVKAESPYGMSAPSQESAPVRIPGRAVDMEFLAVESRIISEALSHQGEPAAVSSAPRRKRAPSSPAPPVTSPSRPRAASNECLRALSLDAKITLTKAEKRESFQLDLLESVSPPPLSLSAPDISSRTITPMPFKALRTAVSSTELLHERAMARFYKAVAMQEQISKKNDKPSKQELNDIPYISIERNQSHDYRYDRQERVVSVEQPSVKTPEIIIKTDSVEEYDYKFKERQASYDSEADFKWQQNISFDEDYTASTVSSDAEYSEEGSLNGDRASQYSNEEETYNPRDKFTRRSPLKESLEEISNSPVPVKPMPVLDPSFVPKPILKKRDVPQVAPSTLTLPKYEEKLKPNRKSKTEDKMPLMKKITKIPLQKSFPFPKILNRKEPQTVKEEITDIKKEESVKKTEQPKDKITEEGRTVIDYYGSIVKEYGSQKKPVTPLYLNTEDLKEVAEKQTPDDKVNGKSENEMVKIKRIMKIKKSNVNKTTDAKKPTAIAKTNNSIHKTHPISKTNMNENSVNKTPSPKEDNANKDQKRYTQQIVLKKTERATIVIPIDYQELEKKAKINVRSAIDYTVDLCLLLLAFWVYFFKDERLAIPFLILIIYRQLQETILMNIPDWLEHRTPTWMKMKTS